MVKAVYSLQYFALNTETGLCKLFAMHSALSSHTPLAIHANPFNLSAESIEMRQTKEEEDTVSIFQYILQQFYSRKHTWCHLG